MSIVNRCKDTSTRFRTVSPEQKGQFGVARPAKGRHPELVDHATDVVMRAYKKTLKELAKV